jgi:hypothetical protein
MKNWRSIRAEQNVIYMKQEHAEMVDRLTSEYGKIFGFQR